MFYLMIIGANVLSYFVTATRMPEAVLQGIGHLNLSPPLILAMLMAIFIVLRRHLRRGVGDADDPAVLAAADRRAWATRRSGGASSTWW